MKALTYNVHGWQTLDGASNVECIARVLAASNADLIGLNEVFSVTADGLAALDHVAQRLGFYAAFGATHSIDPTKHPPYGNAFLSRWPILAYAAHHLAPDTSYGRRGMLEARVRLSNATSFTVYVTHLDHRSEQIRLEQWAAAFLWLQRDRERPHLLLGDFNALALSDYPTAEQLAALAAYQRARGWVAPAFDLVAQIVKAGYTDVLARGGLHPTFPAQAPERRIDYIFAPPMLASSLLAAQPFRTDDTERASDHLPVMADFDFPQRP